MYKAVVFDRDGTLNKTTSILRQGQNPGEATDGYVLAPHELALFPCVHEALRLLRENKVIPLAFTQQNCIGKGLVTIAEVNAIHDHMNDLLGEDAAIEQFYVAFSTPGQPSDPRAKPSPLMLYEAMNDYQLLAKDILVVGDSLRDYRAAQAAGMDFVWVRDDLGRVSEDAMAATGCPIFDDVLEVVKTKVLGAA